MAATTAGRLGKELIACFTPRRFQGELSFLRECPDMCGSGFKIKLVFRDEFFDKLRVGITGPPAQTMIQMANDQLFVTEIDQPVQ